ncbi:MAG: hypothetical protein Q9M31_08695 [Mariprofundus sp.]|nr:hypothetical protein [Mariprofundus sp.]
MHISEFVSIAWIGFFSLFAITAFLFADQDKNQAWVERMGAFLFAAIFISTVAGAMAPHFFAYTLNIPWYRHSTINQTIGMAGIIATWIVFSRGIKWLLSLASASLITGLIFWLTTHIVIGHISFN